jgi:hypothetical protein
VAGELSNHTGDHEEARRALEDALDLFAESAAPYEAALARLALARTRPRPRATLQTDPLGGRGRFKNFGY